MKFKQNKLRGLRSRINRQTLKDLEVNLMITMKYY